MVVRKKVITQKKQIAKVSASETIRTVKTTNAAPKPKVVRKKVVARKEHTAKVQINQTDRVAKKNQTARHSKKTAAVKTEKFQAKTNNLATIGTNPDRQTLVAKNVEVMPTGDTVTKLPASKKPAIKPRSDISEIMQSSTGESTVPSDKLIAATSNVTPKARSRSIAIPKAYDAKGKIDPFEPLFKEKPVSLKKKKNKKRIPRTPLERIDLSQLKLVGIILASSGNRALVEESSGKGYVIKKGTFIGVNSGKVVKIKKEKVVVEEEFEDVFGKTKLRQREIKLPKPPGEF
jgi:type IV pilus assembly protein PilP